MAAKKKPDLVVVSFRSSAWRVKKLKQFCLDAGVTQQMAIQYFIDIGIASGSRPK